jgi:hypothetical protein
VSDDKTARDLPKQGVVGAQGPVSGKSAQTGLSFCGADQLMKNSVCVCKDPSLQACGADCVNQLVDPSNCGACGKVCGPDQKCNGGRCECTVGGMTACPNGCFNLLTDSKNCGGCGKVCGSGQTCEGGICKCSKSGLEICPNGCFDLKNDLNNCGTCGTVCPQKLGAAKCSSGSCGCVDPAMASCPGVGCVNLQSDNGNCGVCGYVCPEGMICSGTGNCRCDENNYWVYEFKDSKGNGSGRCVNINRDPNNCGAPAKICPANAPKCNGGYCIA